MPIPSRFRRLLASTALGLAGIVICSACNDTRQPTAPRPIQPPSAPPASPPASLQRLETVASAHELFVGMRVTVTLSAYRASGEAISTDSARVRSSDTSVTAVEALHLVTIRRLANGEFLRNLQVALVLADEGESELEFTLGDLRKTISMKVLPMPNASAALAVDSFAVVSYTSGTQLIYVPLLKLREPTGARHVEVTAVEFTVPGRSTNLCRGSILYAPGQVAHLNGQDSYLYNNDLIFGAPVNAPLPGGLATARVLIRESDGSTGAIFVTAPFASAPTTAPLPPQAFPGLYWTC